MLCAVHDLYFFTMATSTFEYRTDVRRAVFEYKRNSNLVHGAKHARDTDHGQGQGLLI